MLAASDLKRQEIDIRDAVDADLSDVAAILNAEIATSPFVYAETPVSVDERRRWLDERRKAGLPVIVATDANDPRMVVGWASLSAYRPSSGYRFTAEMSVYVAHRARRRGIGSRLIHSILSDPKATGFHAFVASIDADNLPSIALFERFGFTEAARLPEVGRKFDRWRTHLLLLRVRAA